MNIFLIYEKFLGAVIIFDRYQVPIHNIMKHLGKQEAINLKLGGSRLFKKVHVFRLNPEQELTSEIARYCRQNGISSGVVIGIIGSVKSAELDYQLRRRADDYTGLSELQL